MASLEKAITELNQMTDAANRAKATLNGLIETMMKAPSNAMRLNIEDELKRVIWLEEKRIALVKEYNALSAQGVATNISGRAISLPPEDKRSGQPGFVDPFGGNTLPPKTPTPETVAGRQRAARQAALDAAEAERLAYMRREAFAKESAFMRGQGFNDPASQFKKNISVPGGAFSVSDWSRTDPLTGKQFISKPRVDQMGNVSTGNIPKQNQSFTQGIGKDLGDLMKWSIAIAAIYGPINAVTEAMTQLVANEVKLATVSIALNTNAATTATVFKDVYAASKTAGEEVSLIIDAFGAAYTAAGRINNEYQRYTATVQLLDDAMKLSKLSTLDEAGAIDVLTAALYQTAKAPTPGATSSDTAAAALKRGSDLIDQWVQVSKVAAVTVETLATGVAVLGDSAETAGMSIEQMNAMIATLSEVSLSSGKETANIAKALIGNYQQESAVKELNRLGIAVVDTTGKTRQFLDVMTDVANLRSSGILGNEDFSRLTLALGGGGIRRQKDVSAFIENFGRMQQLSGMQGDAGGASAEALAKQLDTVQTSTTNLQNSFVNLAQTMGNEGGLLDVMSATLKVGTFLVDMFDKLAGAVGKAGPLLLAAGVVKMLTLGKDSGYLTNMLGNNLMIPMAGMMGSKTPTLTGDTWARNVTGQNTPFKTPFGGTNVGLPTALSIALPALQNLAGGKPVNALADIAGGLAGAPWGPVGAMIGVAAAEAMMTAVTYDSAFADFFAGVKKAPEPGKPLAPSPDEIGKELMRNLSGGISAPYGELIANIGKGLSSLKPFQDQKLDAGLGFNTPEAFALEVAKNNNPELYAKAMFEYAKQGQLPAGEYSSLTERQLAISDTPGTKQRLEAMQTSKSDELRTGMIKGDVKQSDFGNRMSYLSAFAVTAPRIVAGIDSEIGGIGDAYKSVEEAYTDYLDIASSGNKELITGINSQIAEIDKVQNLLDKWIPEEKNVPLNIPIFINGVPFQGDFYDLQKLLPGLTKGTANYIDAAATQVRVASLPIRDVYGSNVTPTTGKDLTTVTQDAIKLQDQYYSNLTKEQYDSKKDTFEEFYMWIEESGKFFYKSVVDASGKPLDKAIFGEAFQEAQKAGKTAGDAGGMDWQVPGATAAQIRAAEAQAPPYVKLLEQASEASGGKYESKVEDVLFTTSDKQILTAHGDQKVIQYLLQQILDTEKKQLQGIWNLPEGSYFWANLASLEMSGGGGGGGGTSPTIPGTGTAQPNTKEMQYEQLLREYRNPATPTNSAMTEPIIGEDGRGIGTRAYSNVFSTPPMSDMPKETGILQQLIDAFLLVFKMMPGGFGGPGSYGAGTGIGSFGKLNKDSMSDNLTQPQAASIKFDLKLTSTTQLIVDGRTLASIVKPYLAADFLRTNDSGGSVTRAYVI